jgi:uncharacterized C2H2 Zn-finger protein
MYTVIKIDKDNRQVHFTEDCPICGGVVNGVHNYNELIEDGHGYTIGWTQPNDDRPPTEILTGVQCCH